MLFAFYNYMQQISFLVDSNHDMNFTSNSRYKINNIIRNINNYIVQYYARAIKTYVLLLQEYNTERPSNKHIEMIT